ncbi:MAG TPA: hypothetical protein VNE71_00300, partial [Myxococcota bacterium]|nr:hypothetical protein [Myxococcota bacterium]
MRRKTCFAPALGFGLALALAGVAYAGDPSRDLGDIESAPTRDIGDVDSAESGDSDGASAGAEAEDVVGSEDSDEAEAQSGEMQQGATKSFDEVDADSSGWHPAPCEEVEVDLGSRPPASDVDGWRGELQNAEAAIDKARTKLAARRLAVLRVGVLGVGRGELRARLVDRGLGVLELAPPGLDVRRRRARAEIDLDLLARRRLPPGRVGVDLVERLRRALLHLAALRL